MTFNAPPKLLVFAEKEKKNCFLYKDPNDCSIKKLSKNFSEWLLKRWTGEDIGFMWITCQVKRKILTLVDYKNKEFLTGRQTFEVRLRIRTFIYLAKWLLIHNFVPKFNPLQKNSISSLFYLSKPDFSYRLPKLWCFVSSPSCTFNNYCAELVVLLQLTCSLFHHSFSISPRALHPKFPSTFAKTFSMHLTILSWFITTGIFYLSWQPSLQLFPFFLCTSKASSDLICNHCSNIFSLILLPISFLN